MTQSKVQKTRALGALSVLTFFCASLLLGGCQLTAPVSPTVTHVVLMWLKHPKSAADRAQLIRAAQSLRMIPGVLRVQAGGAIPPVGPHSHQDYDLGVMITFRDRAALPRYEKDPRHVEAMRRYLEPLVRRYEVYNLNGR